MHDRLKCRTRWTERHNAHKHFYQGFTFVVDAMKIIAYGIHLQEYKELNKGFDEMYKDGSTQTKIDAHQIIAVLISSLHFSPCTSTFPICQVSHSNSKGRLQGSGGEGHLQREERSQAKKKRICQYLQTSSV
jgi:hypothetical protein